ncbi:MAG: hypothetical protein Q7J73_08345 [Dehalococcoidales bacterium]|nr:hypothetical protein [Dehalococcoidales bacterium]
MKDKSKRIVILLLSIFTALGITLGTGCALGGNVGIEDEEHGHEAGALEVAFSSSPRFPIVGKEAVLTFKISHNGSLEQGQEVMVMLAKSVAGGHGHEPAPADAGNASEAMPANMPGMDHGAPADEPVPMEHLMPAETSPGVYVAKHTFEQGGRYVATVQIGDEESDVVVAVRSSPIAWWYIIGLAGISALLAGVVAVVKTVRKEW